MFYMAMMGFVAFPDKSNAIFKDSFSKGKKIDIEASGSLGLLYDGKCHQTYPNETIHVDEKIDWCSNIVDDKNSPNPWIMYSLNGKGMKLSGYSVRNGCCWYLCCCLDDGRVADYSCCCRLYSYSLQGSNDNVTWKVIHRVEKDSVFYDCQFKTYEFPETESFKYIRFALDEEYPGCPRCMQVNQLELYGTTTDDTFTQEDDNDESVSIIGKVKSYN